MSNTRTISFRVACGSQNSDELRSKFNMFGSPYYIPLLAEERNILHLNLISIFVFLCASLLRLRSSLGVSRYRAHASRLGVSRYRAHASRWPFFRSVSASAIIRTASVTRSEFVSIIWVASAYRGERSDNIERNSAMAEVRLAIGRVSPCPRTRFQ